MLNKEKPSMLKPLMLAYETTDGNVDTISKLNRYFQEYYPQRILKKKRLNI